MTGILNYLGCLVAVLVFCALPGKAEFNYEKCRGVDIDITEDHMMNVKECVTASGAAKFEELKPEKMACFGKCVLKKKGLIDAKGLPHKENIEKMITDSMPKAVHDDLNKRMGVCLEEETDMIDADDESCNTYMPMMMCIHLAFLEECEK